MINIASNLAPRAGSTYFLLEDIHLKGGYQTAPTLVARDLIDSSKLKEGMLVWVVEAGKLFRYENSAWAETALKGADGTQFYVSDVDPVFAVTAADYDFALNYATGAFFTFNGAGWTQVGSLKGATGSPGIDGVNGIDGADGVDGVDGVDGAPGTRWSVEPTDPAADLQGFSSALNTLTGDVFNFIDGTWLLVGNIRGPQGAAGADGAPGTNGADGAPGTNGVDGLNGVDGADGVDGINGTNGTSLTPRGTWEGTATYVPGDYVFFTNVSGAAIYALLSPTPYTSATTPDLDPTNWAQFFVASGADGVDGAPGADGSIWHTGVVAPDQALGELKDFYFDSAANDVYSKASGSWVIVANIKGAPGTNGVDGAPGTNGTNGVDGAPGTNGTNGVNGVDGIDGADGSRIHFGLVPDDLVGENIDYFFSTTTGNFYSKSTGAWVLLASLRGIAGADGIDGINGTNGVDGADGAPGTNGTNGVDGAPGTNGTNGVDGVDGTNGIDGLNGSVWHSGTDAPAVALGADTDFYLNTVSGDVYQKAGAAWSVVTNIKGPAGTNGTNGTNGVDGAPGTNGTNGVDGTDGADGVNGVDGSTWYSGTGSPFPASGINKDFYFDVATSDVYSKSTGSWAVIANTKGIPGTNGTNGVDGAPGTNGTNGVDGAPGTNGVDGTKIYFGASLPAAGLGVSGDYYLHNVGDLYTKGGSNWVFLGSLKGPAGAEGAAGADGAPGSEWLSGTTVPAAGLGTNKDFYLKTDTGDIYSKSTGTWAFLLNIKGTIDGQFDPNSVTFNLPYDISLFMAGTFPGQNILISSFLASRDISLKVGIPGSVAVASTPAANEAILPIKIGSTLVGTLTFNFSNVGIFDWATDVKLLAGQSLDIYSPPILENALQNIRMVIVGAAAAPNQALLP